MPNLPVPRWSALVAAVAGALTLAAPAAAEPVKAAPATPDELAVLAVEGPAVNATERFSLTRVSSADGSFRGRIGFPTTGESALSVYAPALTALRGASVERSVDGSSLTVAAANVPAGVNAASASGAWRSVRVDSDGTYTGVPWGALPSSSPPVGSVTVDGSRYWFARFTGAGGLGTIAPGDSAATTLSGASSVSPANVEIADGTLYAVAANGVYRAPGGGLPTMPSLAAPELVHALTTAFDAAFVDADGAGGSDTLYVAHGTNGLSKYVRSGDAWVQRGSLSGSHGWITARAVDGAVEVYSTNGALSSAVQKTVDTAEVGAEMASAGTTLLARAPGGVRYQGLAFAPGTGFPADSTPYPPSPPRIAASTTSVITMIGSPNKATLELDVFDANTPGSDLTVTASSNAQWILPDDGITITGTGNTRTVTLNPIAPGGTVRVTFTVSDGERTATAAVSFVAYPPGPDPSGHYYLGLVDVSAALDLGGDYFLGVSDEVNTVRLYKKGVIGSPVASFNEGFPGGETDFEGVTRFGDTAVWTGSHANSRSGAHRPERRFLAFTTIKGSGRDVTLEWRNSYTRLWEQWRDWDASNAHGLGANRLKFDTATRGGVLPNAPNGWNVEGLTMAPGSSSVAWFGMRAPTVTGDDGIERAVILPVDNIDELTSNDVDAELGQPILLDLGGRSIRDIAKNADDQYLISAGTGDTDDSLKSWALFAWDGDPAHDPQMVKELPTDAQRIGAWEGIAELPEDLVAGSRVLMTADSGDTGLGRAYGQYVTLDEPMPGPAAPSGVTATVRPGAIDLTWEPAARADGYYVTVKDAAGQNVPGTPFLTTGTSRTIEPLTAGMEYTVIVRAQNVATRAPAAPVKATPTQGPRTPTSASIELVGTRVHGEALTVVATLSDPAARGTIRFLDGFYAMRGPSGGEQIPVVDGKAEVDATNHLRIGVRPIRAQFTPANPEEFTASESMQAFFIDYRPFQPAAELVAITGPRVAGQPLTLKFKLRGYTESQIYPAAADLPIAIRTRVNGAATSTYVQGTDPRADRFDAATGEVNLTTTTLAAGKHRISGYVGNFGKQATSFATDEIPVEIAPAGSPAPEAPVIEHPKVFMTVAGERVVGRPVTLTARVSDPTLRGTVQFFQDEDDFLGEPVPVENGVASWTGVTLREVAAPSLHARFEPAHERDTTASAVSPGVTIFLGELEPPPFHPETATTTTLEVEGRRVVGESLTAKVTVAPAVAAPFAANDLHGYVEVTDDGEVVDLARVLAGKAEVDLSGLGAGAHSLAARYVTSDEKRSTGSESAAVPVTIAVESRTPADVGGSVPATLALTMGAPATFGAFMPGIEREYAAATTATVTSTAGDAALTVSEPGHLTNGAFSLPQALRVQIAPAAWAGPVSNGGVEITFKQAIGADDALRTGAYGKTLAFTLSTTTP